MVRYCGTWYGTRYDCGAYFWSGGVARYGIMVRGTIRGTVVVSMFCTVVWYVHGIVVQYMVLRPLMEDILTSGT